MSTQRVEDDRLDRLFEAFGGVPFKNMQLRVDRKRASARSNICMNCLVPHILKPPFLQAALYLHFISITGARYFGL